MNTERWKELWTVADGATYLNHGSFGPSPKAVQDDLIRWTRRLESQPMRLFLREMEDQFEAGLKTLAKFLGTTSNNLIYVDNATAGMNVVAASTPLQSGDEVLVTDHEYGAVTRLWRRKCQQAGAKLITCELPYPLDDRAAICDAVMSRVSKKTKIIVISHVTSPTAVELPIDLVCQAARERDVPVCIDGPHATGMIPINIKRLDCDFYTASCHKWLSSAFGSGFLFVHPRQQKNVQPAVVSWGGSLSGRQPSWKDEFHWLGTRNPAPYFSIKTAIEFFKQPAQQFDDSCEPNQSTFELFRHHATTLLETARREIPSITGRGIVECDSLNRDLPMVAFELPELADCELFRDPLMDRLASIHRIETPINSWNGRRLLRVSAHLYNTEADLQKLFGALEEELAIEKSNTLQQPK